MNNLTFFSAAALQSAVLLMGAPNLLEYYQDEDWAKEGYIDWNITTSRNILKAWQKEFTKVRHISLLKVIMMSCDCLR